MIRIALIGLAVTLGTLLTRPGWASLYQPDDPMIVPVRPDGVAEPFPFEEFKRRFVSLGNLTNPTLKNPDGGPSDRDRMLARVKARQQARGLSADEKAGLAADMLRLGNTDAGSFVNDALNLLSPLTRDRAPSYFVFTTLAEVHAARGEWAEAVTYHDGALSDCELPVKVKGWTDAQREWVSKLDQGYVRHYLRLRQAEAEARPRPAPETEGPTALFPLPDRKRLEEPLRFVNDAGAYEPGVLATAEQAKLPRDAIAIVQQLLLWFPGDTRLYWLLAELYAAANELATAEQIMDECAWARQYGNRKALMEHRTAITAVVEARRKEADQAAVDALPISMGTIGIYFGAVCGLGVLAIVRTVVRRSRRGTRGR